MASSRKRKSGRRGRKRSSTEHKFRNFRGYRANLSKHARRKSLKSLVKTGRSLGYSVSEVAHRLKRYSAWPPNRLVRKKIEADARYLLRKSRRRS